ncbi:MAG: glutamate--cysteine ligase [Gammaproteobacteria bacterium]|nr:glutamate--cysteine ligase [Gammaproteobacteria bacterium]
MHNTIFKTPHLTTALTGPLQLLEKQILNQQNEIEEWLQAQWKKTPAPIYGSVDLRNAGFKLAPVDMNLFPGGFNNLQLNPIFMSLSSAAADIAIQKIADGVKNILLIPENHTRNIFYWENVSTLLTILKNAGFDARVGSLLPDLTQPTEISVASGGTITITPLQRKENLISIEGFIPDLILLNNDLSDGIPDILQGLDQIITPPAELGWSQRLKSEHFQYYADISKEFSDIIKIDPWLISPLFLHCGEVDFMKSSGQACLISNVEELLSAITKKYAEYNIPHAPYVVVKADAGTYGMAIMMVKSVDEVRALNRKQRTHMSKSKGGQPVNKVIIQEGVYTFETWGEDNAVTEPVVYMWGERVVGGFYRIHKDRGVDENLNSPGMHFEPLAFAKHCSQPVSPTAPDECQNRFYAYGVIARLSMLAAAREISDQKASV